MQLKGSFGKRSSTKVATRAPTFTQLFKGSGCSPMHQSSRSRGSASSFSDVSSSPCSCRRCALGSGPRLRLRFGLAAEPLARFDIGCCQGDDLRIAFFTYSMFSIVSSIQISADFNVQKIRSCCGATASSSEPSIAGGVKITVLPEMNSSSCLISGSDLVWNFGAFCFGCLQYDTSQGSGFMGPLYYPSGSL